MTTSRRDRIRAGERLSRFAACLPAWDDLDISFHGYLSVQSRGVVALPAELRRRLGLDEPGAQLEITEREDGVLELRPALPVPADQWWFWSQRWQERELEVDEHVAGGRSTVHDDGDALLTHSVGLTDES